MKSIAQMVEAELARDDERRAVLGDKMIGRSTGPDEVRVTVPRPVARSKRGKVLARSRAAIIREARRLDERTADMGVQALSFPREAFSVVWFTTRFPAEDGLQ